MQCVLLNNLIQIMFGADKYDLYYGFNEDCLKLIVYIFSSLTLNIFGKIVFIEISVAIILVILVFIHKKRCH